MQPDQRIVLDQVQLGGHRWAQHLAGHLHPLVVPGEPMLINEALMDHRRLQLDVLRQPRPDQQLQLRGDRPRLGPSPRRRGRRGRRGIRWPGTSSRCASPPRTPGRSRHACAPRSVQGPVTADVHPQLLIKDHGQGPPFGSSTWRLTIEGWPLLHGRVLLRLAEHRPTHQVVPAPTHEVVRGQHLQDRAKIQLALPGAQPFPRDLEQQRQLGIRMRRTDVIDLDDLAAVLVTTCTATAPDAVRTFLTNRDATPRGYPPTGS